MKKALLITAILVSFCLKAQLNYQWAYNFGGVNTESAQAISVDPSGNVYICGTFSSTVDFDPGPSINALSAFSGSPDIFLAKYSSTGAFIWVKQIGGTNTEKAYDVYADASGVWLAGNFMGTCDMDPSAVTNNITSLGGGQDGDGFFSKFDVNGNLLWVDRIGSTANDRVMGITADASGNCYITGFIGGNTDFDPSAASFSLNVSATYNAYFAKYTSTGALTYAKQITGAYSDGYDITLDGSNLIYITGSFGTGTSDFDPGPGTANLNTASTGDAYFARYDNAGNYQYANKAGGPGIDIGFTIKADGSGNIHMGGTFSNGCDFDPTATSSVIANAGSGDMFVAKYSSAGALQWAVGTGGTQNDYCYGVGIDGSGNVYIAGKFQGTNIDFDPSASSNLLTATIFCPFVAGYTSSGGFIFAGQPGNIGGEARHLIVNGSSVYITGWFNQTGDFDFSASTATLVSNGAYDAFFAKYNVCTGSPAQPSAISGPTLTCYGTAATYSVVNDPTASSYSWTFPTGWTGSSSVNTISVVSGTSGNISVTANGCTPSTPSTLSVTVGGFTNAVVSSTNTNCNASCDGTAGISPVGGTSPLTYSWSSSQTTATVTTLCAGNYSITITDNYACSITKTVSVGQPPTLSLNIVGTTSANCSQSNGGATVIASGGNPGYTYSWTAGPTTAAYSNITPGNYTVSMNDTKNCGPVTLTVSVGNIPGPTISNLNFANAKCFNANNGSATVTASGPTTPLTYSWVPSSLTTSVVNTLAPGNHTVIVKDNANCTTNSVITITQPSSAVTVSVSQSSFTMCASNPTNLNSAASGGVGSYTYTWNPGNLNGATVTVLPSSNTVYTVTAADANSCTSIASVSVYTSSSPTVITVANPSVICVGQSATITASGAASYTWNTSSNSNSIVVTPSVNTNYTVNGTGTLVCTGFSSISLNVNPNPTVSASTNASVLCIGGAAVLTATGANTYTWSTSATGNSISISPATTSVYVVTGTGSNGCTNSFTITQNVSSCAGLIDQALQYSTTIYPNPFSNELHIKVYKNCTLEIRNTLGQVVINLELHSGEQKLNTENLAEGVYFIRIDDIKPIKLIKE